MSGKTKFCGSPRKTELLNIVCASNLVKRIQAFTINFILNLQGQYAGGEAEAIGYKNLYGRNSSAHET